MKKLLSSFLIAFALVLGGCAQVGKLTTAVFDQIALVRDEFNALLPSDFNGPVNFSRSDSYFDINLRAGNVHRNEAGEWTWDYVDYERKTHFPGWSSNVRFTLGETR